MQLLNGQRNLSGADMRGLDLSNIDFRGASMCAHAVLALLSGRAPPRALPCGRVRPIARAFLVD
jgi:hypothetical protein